ncbi:Methyltransferase-like protein [Spironucleus salmonicida]|uniref:Methyltransferase-like protein n=1 Tax=Spironucleus salmonicida TaxID=348837 RepID=V6LWI6_9EUKA|nr:Methyltransferase-like protein [Spironucleus salmonicida]|eukprot:EST48613.1 Methyltransferase-like protein [Spironucleus salmonicida]
MNKPWERFFKTQKHPYQDRHWLWILIPELFPVPAHRSSEEILCKTFACAQCAKLYEIRASCIHMPLYQSQIDLTQQKDQLRAAQVPFASKIEPQISLLDVGCGTGSTSIPLLEKNGAVKVTAFDFSETAINWLKKREFYDEERILGLVDDAVTCQIGQFDYAVLIFVLSAIPDVKGCLRNMKTQLKINGVLFITDYSNLDTKVIKRNGTMTDFGIQCVREGDGTLLLGFDLELLEQYLVEIGFVVYEKFVWTRQEMNRKTGYTFVRSHFIVKVGISAK